MVVGRMFGGEGAWAVRVCISCSGDRGQLGNSFLWSGRGGWGNLSICLHCARQNVCVIVVEKIAAFVLTVKLIRFKQMVS